MAHAGEWSGRDASLLRALEDIGGSLKRLEDFIVSRPTVQGLLQDDEGQCDEGDVDHGSADKGDLIRGEDDEEENDDDDVIDVIDPNDKVTWSLSSNDTPSRRRSEDSDEGDVDHGGVEKGDLIQGKDEEEEEEEEEEDDDDDDDVIDRIDPYDEWGRRSEYSEVQQSDQIQRVPYPETEYYRVTDEKWMRFQNEDWFRTSLRSCRDVSPTVTIMDLEQVTDSRWSYFKPAWLDGCNKLGGLGFRYCHNGKGRPNFLGPWEKLPMEHDLHAEHQNDHKLFIPYSSVPPIDLDVLLKSKQYRLPFTQSQRANLDDKFNGLWTLPPDYRLNFDFQNHMLRQLDAVKDIDKHIRHIRKKHDEIFEGGGSYEVEDIDPQGSSHKYSIKNKLSAIEVEEWVLDIPPHLFRTTPQMYPLEYRVADMWKSMPFNRIVTIRGFAGVYTQIPWCSVDIDPHYIPDDHILKLHSTLQLRADETLSAYPPVIFHITWMDIQETEKEDQAPTKKRRSQDYLSLTKTAGSVQFFGTLSSITDRYWTLLVLVPKTKNQRRRRSNLGEGQYNLSRQNLLITMCTIIDEFMDLASSSWMRVGSQFEELILLEKWGSALHKDSLFSQFHKLFWVINEIDRMLPLVSDAVQQWSWYCEVNNLRKAADGELFGSLPPNERELQRKHLKNCIKSVDEKMRRLRNSQEWLRELRERAHSLRDGLIAIESLKEAKESRVLSENVRLLTYITIFYLPIAFCSSLWAINDMFGTGVRGFGIITTSISLGTYVVAFSFLQSPARTRVVNTVVNILPYMWRPESRKPTELEKSKAMLLTGSRERKEEVDTQLDRSESGGAQELRKRIPSVISRLSGGKEREQDHELGLQRKSSTE